MNDDDWLARRFEENRPHLRAVAYRMLGSASEADDAVQESWLRLSRADTGDVRNLRGWLTTVVSRVSLDMLRSRSSRREDPLDAGTVESPAGDDPERETVLADSIGPALLVVLDSLAPAERLAFVLHDMFAVPFDEIARILGRSPAAVRQLASRARRRVQGAQVPDGADANRQRDVVSAFLAASRNGDFEALLTLLDPDVVLHADQGAVDSARSSGAEGAPRLASVMRGAGSVASAFSGRAAGTQPALVAGAAGAAWAPGGRPRAVFRFVFTADAVIAGIDVVTDPALIDDLAVTLSDV